MRVVPLLILLLVHILLIFGPCWAPNPRNLSKNSHFSGEFPELVFSGLKALQVPLESLLERPMLVLRTPKTRKVLFSHSKITFVANAVFRYFEVLKALLGSILALLGPF